MASCSSLSRLSISPQIEKKEQEKQLRDQMTNRSCKSGGPFEPLSTEVSFSPALSLSLSYPPFPPSLHRRWAFNTQSPGKTDHEGLSPGLVCRAEVSRHFVDPVYTRQSLSP